MTTTLLIWVTANWPVLILATISVIVLAAFLRPGEPPRLSAEAHFSLSGFVRRERDGNDSGNGGDGGGD